MQENRLSHADLRANTALDLRSCPFFLFTDSELDLARFLSPEPAEGSKGAQIGLPPRLDAFSACFEQPSALLR